MRYCVSLFIEKGYYWWYWNVEEKGRREDQLPESESKSEQENT